jgi:hypothetical protein
MRSYRCLLLFWHLIFVAVCLIPESIASAQIKSRGTAVQLLATLPEALTVRYQSVPVAFPFAKGDSSPLEILHVFVQWRLRPGQNVEVQLARETGGTQTLLFPSGFIGLPRTSAPSYTFSFLSPTEDRVVVLDAPFELTGGQTGGASLLISPGPRAPGDPTTIRVTVAVL